MKDSITILIVDDEYMVVNVLEKILMKKGFNVRTARNGQAAKEFLYSEPIDVILSDIIMPDMDGFELLQYVKEIFPAVPVIMMTGKGDADMVRKATQLGADEYITKPIKGDELSLVIERISWQLMAGENKSAKPGTGLKSGN